MSEYDIETVELSIEEAQKKIDLMNAVDKLKSNRDFKKVVLQGYFENEAIRLVSLKANPGTQSKEDQEQIIKYIDSIGSFMNYLNMIRHQGKMAESSLEDFERTRDELLAEEV